MAEVVNASATAGVELEGEGEGEGGSASGGAQLQRGESETGRGAQHQGEESDGRMGGIDGEVVGSCDNVLITRNTRRLTRGLAGSCYSRVQ